MSYDNWKLATPPEYDEEGPDENIEGANVWWDDIWQQYCACRGDYDFGEHNIGTGKTRAEAIEALKEMEGLSYTHD